MPRPAASEPLRRPARLPVLPASTAQATAYRAALRPLLAELDQAIEQLLEDLGPALRAREDADGSSRVQALLARLRSVLLARFSPRALLRRLAAMLDARAGGVERVAAAALRRQLEAMLTVNPKLPKDAVATTLTTAGEARATAREGWVEENTRLISSIGQRARAEVEELVRGAATKGSRIETLSRQLRERLGVARSRADLIARDQTSKLASQVSEAQQRAIGVERYTWRHSGIRQGARPEHLARDGKVFRWDQPPPDGHPGMAPNCRCTAEPVIERLPAAPARS